MHTMLCIIVAIAGYVRSLHKPDVGSRRNGAGGAPAIFAVTHLCTEIMSYNNYNYSTLLVHYNYVPIIMYLYTNTAIHSAACEHIY